jgi:hypothetical protein
MLHIKITVGTFVSKLTLVFPLITSSYVRFGAGGCPSQLNSGRLHTTGDLLSDAGASRCEDHIDGCCGRERSLGRRIPASGNRGIRHGRKGDVNNSEKSRVGIPGAVYMPESSYLDCALGEFAECRQVWSRPNCQAAPPESRTLCVEVSGPKNPKMVHGTTELPFSPGRFWSPSRERERGSI